jgi:hypothetical protein
MPVTDFQKLLTVPAGSSRKFPKFYIIPLDANTGDILPDMPAIYLQYWPESLSYDRGSINWNNTDVPGSSHGLLSWGSNGNPTLSFTAIFSRDHDPAYMSQDDRINSIKPGPLNKSGDIYHDVNIDAINAWFAAAANPKYASNTSVIAPSTPVQPPPILQIVPEYISPQDGLALGEAISGSLLSGQSSRRTRGVELSMREDRDFYCVLSSFSVEFQSFFPSGAARLAQISLSFTETIQIGGAILPHGRDANIQLAKKYELSLTKLNSLEAIDFLFGR